MSKHKKHSPDEPTDKLFDEVCDRLADLGFCLCPKCFPDGIVDSLFYGDCLWVRDTKKGLRWALIAPQKLD